MIHAHKYISTDSRYLRKKHYCPDCQKELKVIKVTHVVNWKSPEAKKYDFSAARGTYYIGNVKFHWKELQCPYCNRQFTAEQMRGIEGKNRFCSMVSPSYAADKNRNYSLRNRLLFFFFAVLIIIVVWMLKNNIGIAM